VSIAKLKNANDEPVADVVKKLEDLLRRAKQGRLREFACVGSLTGGEITVSYSTDDIPNMTGQLTYLIHALNMNMYEGHSVTND
jgi:hypothetical protein